MLKVVTSPHSMEHKMLPTWIFIYLISFWLITDNKSLNNTDSNIKPKVWVETGQMHQRDGTSADNVDHNENTILDDNNEVSEMQAARA